LGPGAHTTPHAPQLVVVSSRASQPSLTLPLQSAKFVLHAVMRHVPDEHEGVALGGAHERPQAPQFARLLLRSTQAPEQSVPLVHWQVPPEHV
jgi:flavin reductase (DIM6/NTAB) family NADH-FMN oxidoreductase RutF